MCQQFIIYARRIIIIDYKQYANVSLFGAALALTMHILFPLTGEHESCRP